MKDVYLVHHGVKGMKWGVRHNPITFGRGRRGNDIYKKQQNNKKKGLTTKQKRIIGAVAVGAALAAVGYVGIKSLKSKPKIVDDLVKNNINNIAKPKVNTINESSILSKSNIRTFDNPVEPKIKVNKEGYSNTAQALQNNNPLFKNIQPSSVQRNNQQIVKNISNQHDDVINQLFKNNEELMRKNKELLKKR